MAWYWHRPASAETSRFDRPYWRGYDRILCQNIAMAYNKAFAQRIRSVLARRGADEMEMFGGIGFLTKGNTICGIQKEHLMLHVPAEATAELLTRPGAMPFVQGGRQMNGWLLVTPEAITTDAQLATWIAIAADYAYALPGKSANTKKSKAKKK